MSQISLTFPDGNAREFDKGVTPAEVAESISKSLSKKAISAMVNGQHHDLQWPITEDAQIAINTMQDDAPALELIRHDLAHIMARAVQEIWPDVKVTIGPVRDNGWFYDFDREEPFTPEDLGAIEKRMKEIINARDTVRTELWTRDQVRQYYTDNGEPYKIEILDRIPEGEDIRMYWHGDWQDLCRGPHLQHTGQVPADAFKLMNVSAAYFLGDNTRPMLQRIYGVAFKNRDDLKKYLTFLEEAEKRDPTGLYNKARAGEIPQFTGVSDPFPLLDEHPAQAGLRLSSQPQQNHVVAGKEGVDDLGDHGVVEADDSGKQSFASAEPLQEIRSQLVSNAHGSVSLPIEVAQDFRFRFHEP